MVRALLVTHGSLGQSLVEVVEHFLGPQDGVEVLSNQGRSADDLRGAAQVKIDGLGEDDGLVLFSDLSGGSCDVACRAGARAHERCVSISGVNLPMLLEFCHYRDRLALPALVERILHKAQSGVRVCRKGEENGASQPRSDR